MGEWPDGEQDLVLGHSILLISDMVGHPRGSTCLWPETRKEERVMVMHDDSCFSPSCFSSKRGSSLTWKVKVEVPRSLEITQDVSNLPTTFLTTSYHGSPELG